MINERQQQAGHGWVVAMTWSHLAFIHWRVEPQYLQHLIPPPLQIDLFDDTAWLGVVPFYMSGVRRRYLPPLCGTSAFPELNVRTYVRYGEERGVWFFSLDAMSRLAVWGARRFFHLPYYYARMKCAWDGEQVRYESCRRRGSAPSPRSSEETPRVDKRWWIRPTGHAKFKAVYRPVGDVFEAAPGSLDYFLTARYCLYSCNASGQVGRGDIHHLPWPLQPGKAQIDCNTMIDVLGIPVLDEPPRVLYSQEIQTVAWPIVSIASNLQPVAEGFNLGTCDARG